MKGIKERKEMVKGSDGDGGVSADNGDDDSEGK